MNRQRVKFRKKKPKRARTLKPQAQFSHSPLSGIPTQASQHTRRENYSPLTKGTTLLVIVHSILQSIPPFQPYPPLTCISLGRRNHECAIIPSPLLPLKGSQIHGKLLSSILSAYPQNLESPIHPLNSKCGLIKKKRTFQIV